MMNKARRNFLAAALACAMSAQQLAHSAEADPAAARIRTFYDALLDTMKRADTLGVRGRYDKLVPAVRSTFDLPAMTRIAVGLEWKSISPELQTALVEEVSRLTIATYANRFDGYSGERFEVDPVTEARNANRVVRTKLVNSKDTVALNYLTHQASDGWKVIDVYLSGTISELATRRSEFGALLKSGGASVLAENLKQRADKLLAGK